MKAYYEWVTLLTGFAIGLSFEVFVPNVGIQFLSNCPITRHANQVVLLPRYDCHDFTRTSRM
jgi:hypothetical protein